MMNSLIFVLCVCLSFNTEAQVKKSLTPKQLQRAAWVKEVLVEVENKPLKQIVRELESTPHPEMNLLIKETMAKTYEEIVQEQDVKGRSKKEWLYSMIAINMAYFQFGGDYKNLSGPTNLNMLIRRKIKSHLPDEVFKDPAFYADLG